MLYPYYWINPHIQLTKRRIHLVSSKKSDVALCGLTLYNDEILGRLNAKPIEPICKHCLKKHGSLVWEKKTKKKELCEQCKNPDHDGICTCQPKRPIVKEFEKLRSPNIPTKEEIEKSLKESEKEMVRMNGELKGPSEDKCKHPDRDPNVYKLRAKPVAGEYAPPNPGEQTIRDYEQKFDQLVAAGFKPQRAAELARMELGQVSIDEAISMHDGNDQDEFSSYLGAEEFNANMSILAETLTQVSTLAHKARKEAEVVLRKTFEAWQKDANSELDFQHFHQVCHLRNLIKDLKKF